MLELRGAHREELDAAAACIGAAFRPDDPARRARLAEQFTASLTLDTRFAVENTRVAILDGRIVSVVQIADRRMLIDGTAVRLGVLPWVGTHPDHQGLKLGTRLLWDAADFMVREGYDLSWIGGEGRERFYEQAGWRNFQHYYKVTLSLPETLPAVEFAGEIRPIRGPDELEAILAIFDGNNRDATGPAIRRREFWRAYEPGWGYPLFLVAIREGRVVGYLRSGWQRGIVEVGTLPDAGDAALPLALHACREARQAGLEAIDVIESFPALQELERRGCTARRRKVSGKLYRILRLAPLLEKLLPRMQERWRRSGLSGWSGSLQIASEAGDVWIESEAGRLRVVSGESAALPSIRLHLTLGQSIDLCLGQAEPDRLPIETSGDRKLAIEALGTLFPPRAFHWYPKDAF